MWPWGRTKAKNDQEPPKTPPGTTEPPVREVGEDFKKARALIDQIRNELTTERKTTFSHSGREESSRPPRRKQDRPKSGGPDVDSIVSKQPEKIATPSANHHILILNDKGEWKERITSSQRITWRGMKLVGDRWIGPRSNLEVIEFPDDPWPAHDTGKSFTPSANEFKINKDSLYKSQRDHEEFMTGAWLQSEKHPQRFLRDGLRQMYIIRIVQDAKHQKHIRLEHNLQLSGQNSPESEGSDAGEDSLDDVGLEDHSEWATEIDFGNLGLPQRKKQALQIEEDGGDEEEWDM